MDLDRRKKIIIGAIVIVLLIAGVFFLRGKGTSQKKEEPRLTEEAKKEETPAPTEEPKFKKSDYTIKIQNGSGKAGLSASLQKDLEKDGYKIGSTANADNFDYKNTIMRAKKSVPEKFIDELKEKLTDKYKKVEIEELKKDEDVDVIIIIGGQQVKETEVPPTKSAEVTGSITPTSSPTVTPTPTP